MEHPRETTSAVFETEPADGSTLVLRKSTFHGEPEWEVIWRDDAEARRWAGGGDPDGQHWFRASDEDAMELHQYLKYADEVYNLGSLVGRLGKDN
ncbi:hypothetical protein [Plantactinospora sp. WMMB782]|uniref:hypothetical protein n=1 Tax=Plantactinospora sp. WMMB782 TaxID=3404121 RepID=UPI003B932EFC